MQEYFHKFRKGIIGLDAAYHCPDQQLRKIIYADWIGSGRSYAPIEQRMQKTILPLVANTHTTTSTTGTAMTHAYHQAQRLIKQHVNAAPKDVIITATSGMTRLINKFQRILNLKYGLSQYSSDQRPVVFITHMEHHSNHTSWLETNTTLEIINPTQDGLVDLDHFKRLLEQYKHRPLKIASVTACSNVTGIDTPYHQIAGMIHAAGGYCFVDFACAAPYVHIDMHPAEKDQYLDAIFFSPHKFLGGPGSSGVLVFNSALYHRTVPDNPGGGTVEWTNPWGGHKYVADIEAREDGGTPAFLQTIKTAMCISLKEQMGVDNMMQQEHFLINRLWDRIESLSNLHILAPKHRNRLAILSFYIDNLHYNLGVRLLNDRFGIQCRGGCSCAGTYGHYLLNVDHDHSKHITDMIDEGNYAEKPGWIRISLHPTMTVEEIDFIGDGIIQLAKYHQVWGKKYTFDKTFCNLKHQEFDLDGEIMGRINHALEDDFCARNQYPIKSTEPESIGESSSEPFRNLGV